jgi:acid phosphatase
MLAAIVCSLAGCASRPTPLYEAESAVASYIDSGRYAVDVNAVVAQAQAYLEQRASRTRTDTAPLAIVLDIDETSLSNWPAYKANNYSRIMHGPCDLNDGPCGLFAYQAMGVSPAIQPTLKLARTARALGVQVIFISGRSGDLRAATDHNLREQGYEFDQLIVYPPGMEKFPSAVQFKAPHRAALEAGGLKIVLCMGDQQSDLDGGHCERTFKLPNPVYFLP